eukprot:TRINITY_DN9764_c0_g1_i1.p2 TRINITY_DN9764_c0_g1~~TRINITY_DN9764_c0_g1_i1.p2  ORF type:complete len:140 (-),score=24.45 TRINITY_DN9764_c0_g1_i1:105-524(-)
MKITLSIGEETDTATLENLFRKGSNRSSRDGTSRTKVYAVRNPMVGDDAVPHKSSQNLGCVTTEGVERGGRRGRGWRGGRGVRGNRIGASASRDHPQNDLHASQRGRARCVWQNTGTGADASPAEQIQETSDFAGKQEQ